MAAKMFERRHHFLGTEISQSLLNSQLSGRCLLARTRITGSLFQTIDMNGLRHAATRAPLNGQLRSAVKPSSRGLLLSDGYCSKGRARIYTLFHLALRDRRPFCIPRLCGRSSSQRKSALVLLLHREASIHASRIHRKKKADTQPKTETPKRTVCNRRQNSLQQKILRRKTRPRNLPRRGKAQGRESGKRGG